MNKDDQWSLPIRYIVLGLVVLLFAVALYLIRRGIEPLILAAFIAYLITPAVNFLTRRTRLSRSGAVNLVYIAMLVLLIGTPISLMPLFFNESTEVFADLLKLFN